MECKFKSRLKPDGVTRINRYIMECKYWWTGTAAASTVELIDTLWNVN